MVFLFLILAPVAIGSYNLFFYPKYNPYSISIMNINKPPENLSIEGPIRGKAGTLYNYSFYCDDPEGDDVNYYIKWGIPSCPAIYGTYPSSSSAMIGFLWKNQGRYNITVKAVDIHGAESDMVSLFVTMPHYDFIKRAESLFLQLNVQPYFEKYISYI